VFVVVLVVADDVDLDVIAVLLVTVLAPSLALLVVFVSVLVSGPLLHLLVFSFLSVLFFLLWFLLLLLLCCCCSCSCCWSCC